MRGRFSLTGFPDELFSFTAMWQRIGLLLQAHGLGEEPLFVGNLLSDEAASACRRLLSCQRKAGALLTFSSQIMAQVRSMIAASVRLEMGQRQIKESFAARDYCGQATGGWRARD
jgi:hypothetical protein